ncbi:MAG: hypothetical protein GX556_01015 [Fibrobacter sp.]|nr:hypothetical protein [Fibrobacter sp.]
MFFIRNNQLIVSVLDPVSDRFRLGSRYCTGGYIWQIRDLSKGDLLSGPLYPDPVPSRFDGQGAPEVFETALGAENASVGEQVLVIGVGTVLRSSPVEPFHVRDNPDVVEFCSWRTKINDFSVVMDSDQEFSKRSGETLNEYRLHLQRTVSLQDRQVCSASTLKNTGICKFRVRWFAHPFFPLNSDLSCCSFSTPVSVPENPGFYLTEGKILKRHSEHNWEKGCYQPLGIKSGEPLKITQFHPLSGSVEVNCNFPLAWMPVWGNSRTFSFEPYFDTDLSPGESLSWQISYGF